MPVLVQTQQDPDGGGRALARVTGQEKLGSSHAARLWADRLQEIAAQLEDHGFDLAAEDVMDAVERLAREADPRRVA